MAICQPARVESLRIAEKSVGWQVVHQVLGSCHQARFVMLDRDPRDVFVSVLHFNRQRGYAAFGAEYGTDELARRIADFYVEAGNAITRWGAKAHTVRYAAMVTDPIGTIRGVTHSTGELTVDPRQIAELSSPQHVTSPSTVESIGRWRTEEAAWPHQFAVLAQAYERFLDVSRPDRQALT